MSQLRKNADGFELEENSTAAFTIVARQANPNIRGHAELYDDSGAVLDESDEKIVDLPTYLEERLPERRLETATYGHETSGDLSVRYVATYIPEEIGSGLDTREISEADTFTLEYGVRIRDPSAWEAATALEAVAEAENNDLRIKRKQGVFTVEELLRESSRYVEFTGGRNKRLGDGYVRVLEQLDMSGEEPVSGFDVGRKTQARLGYTPESEKWKVISMVDPQSDADFGKIL